MNLWKKQPQLTLLAQRITQQFTTALQVVSYSLFFSHVTFISYVYAGPTGGVVVGGAGNISQSGLTTTVNQTTGSMAIDWASYNLNANERVQYNMDASAISLNSILSNSGSQIFGRIEIGVKYHIDSLTFCNYHFLYAKTAPYRI